MRSPPVVEANEATHSLGCDGPSSHEYVSRSPKGMSPGLGRPGAPAPTFPSMNDGPSSQEYLRRSPEGMARGPWGGPADARQLSPRPPESADSDGNGERGS